MKFRNMGPSWPGQDFRFQVSRHHYSNLAVVISIKIRSFIQLTMDREGLYHWQQYEQVPLTFTYEEATQESCRNVKYNMSTISFHNMDASKIYLWAKSNQYFSVPPQWVLQESSGLCRVLPSSAKLGRTGTELGRISAKIGWREREGGEWWKEEKGGEGRGDGL